MTHQQEPKTPETATSGPLSAPQSDSGAPDGGARDRPSCGHAEPPDIRQLRAERDLLARTVAVYTRQTAAQVLADTREALSWADGESTHRPQVGDPSPAGHSVADPSGGGAV